MLDRVGRVSSPSCCNHKVIQTSNNRLPFKVDMSPISYIQHNDKDYKRPQCMKPLLRRSGSENTRDKIPRKSANEIHGIGDTLNHRFLRASISLLHARLPGSRSASVRLPRLRRRSCCRCQRGLWCLSQTERGRHGSGKRKKKSAELFDYTVMVHAIVFSMKTGFFMEGKKRAILPQPQLRPGNLLWPCPELRSDWFSESSSSPPQLPPRRPHPAAREAGKCC